MTPPAPPSAAPSPIPAGRTPGGGYSDIEWPPTGERLTAETFDKYRKEQPGMAIINHRIPDSTVTTAVAHPGVMIASDAIVYIDGKGHPRASGTFAQVLGVYVREKHALSLMDALGKMTLLPARRLEKISPAMHRKGRVQVGADADLTLFDPAIVVDRATYAEPTRTSAGIPYVIVGGVPVMTWRHRDGGLSRQGCEVRTVGRQSAILTNTISVSAR